jgi:hypothetical protein
MRAAGTPGGRSPFGSDTPKGVLSQNPVQPGGLLCQPKVPIHREMRSWI